MTKYIKIIDSFSTFIGNAVAWLVLIMVIGTLYNVVVRYFFDTYVIQLEEAVRIMNAMVFLLAAPLLLNVDKHVRVDVFYSRFSQKQRAIVDLFGTLFLLFPMCSFLLYFSWEYVGASWSQNEASPNTGGLPGLYYVKSLIILTACLLILQGTSELIKKIQLISHQSVQEDA